MADQKFKNKVKLQGGASFPTETASRAPVIDASGNLVSSAVTSTELGYISGLTSSAQTQIGDAQADATQALSDAGAAQADATQALTDAGTAQTAITNHLSDTTDAHDASAISNVPAGNLAATDIQGAVNELQSDIDNRALDSAVIKKNGSVVFTASQSHGGFGITSLADGSSATDAATKGQMDIADGLKVAKAGDTMSGNLAMGNNKVTGVLAGSASNDAVNKAQLDAVSAGLTWLEPALAVNLVGDSLDTPPGSPGLNDIYIAGATPTGDWATFPGYVFQWNGSIWVDLLARAVAAGDRFGVSFVTTTVGSGGLASKDNKIATVNSPTPGAITYTFETPTTGKEAIFVNAPLAAFFGYQYTYNLSSTTWVQFGGTSALNAGIGLVISGNVLSVNMGAGIAQLPSDEVGVDVHTAGGLFTTVDNSSSSTVTGAQLAIKLDGSTLSKSSSGLKLGDTAVTPASQGSATAVSTFTVDQQGRLTAAGNTTIAIPASQVTDFNEAAQDAVGTIFVDTASIDFTYTDGTPSITAVVLPAGVDHDSLNNYVANKHIDHSAVSIATAADSGLTGGGDITATRNISVDIAGTTALAATPAAADTFLVYDASATALKKVTYTELLAGVAVGSAGDIEETSFSIANNQGSAANVTGFAFAAGVTRSFTCLVSVEIDATLDLFEQFTLSGINKAGSFDMASSAVGDESGVTFSITAGGQIQYTSASYAGFSAGAIKFRAQTTTV